MKNFLNVNRRSQKVRKIAFQLTALVLWTNVALSEPARIGTELGNGTEGIQLRSTEPTAPITIENLYKLRVSCQLVASSSQGEAVVQFSRSNEDFTATWKEGRRTRDIAQGSLRQLIEKLVERVPTRSDCAYTLTRAEDLTVFVKESYVHARNEYLVDDNVLVIEQMVMKNKSQLRSLQTGVKHALNIAEFGQDSGRMSQALSRLLERSKKVEVIDNEQTKFFKGLFDNLWPAQATLARDFKFPVNGVDRSSDLTRPVLDPRIGICTAWRSGFANDCENPVPARWSDAAVQKYKSVYDLVQQLVPDLLDLLGLKTFAQAQNKEPRILEAMRVIEEHVVARLQEGNQDPKFPGSFEALLADAWGKVVIGHLKELQVATQAVGKILPETVLYRALHGSRAGKAQDVGIDILRIYPHLDVGLMLTKVNQMNLGDEIFILRGIRSTLQNAQSILIARWPQIDRLSQNGCGVIPTLAGSVARFKYQYLEPIGVVVDPDFASSFYVQEIMATFKALNDFGYNNESPAEFLEQTLPQWETVCASVRDQVLAEIKRFEK